VHALPMGRTARPLVGWHKTLHSGRRWPFMRAAGQFNPRATTRALRREGCAHQSHDERTPDMV